MDTEKLIEHVIHELDQTEREAEALRREVADRRISYEALLETARKSKKSR